MPTKWSETSSVSNSSIGVQSPVRTPSLNRAMYSSLSTDERLVLDPMRLERLGPAPFGVLLPPALEPRRLRVAFEREDVRRDTVEEPAVVCDHDGAAGELEQRIFECAQRVDVEIVRRLVEQQHVAAARQQLRQMHAVPLSAREVADALLLIAALEVEPRDVLPRVHFLL